MEEAGRDSSLILSAFPARLKGYDLVWNYYSSDRAGGAANIEPNGDSSIFGLVVEIEDSLLPVWDKTQGHPRFYDRGTRRLPVQRLSDGKNLFAWVYRAKPNGNGKRNVWPTQTYKKSVLEAAEFWKLPKKYLKRIKDWRTQ